MITSNEKKCILLSFFLAALSGIFIFVVDYFFKIQNEWGLSSHPALSILKGFHYLATPLVLISIGFIVKEHIKRKLRNFKRESRRKTGFLLIIGFFVMSFSGQFLLIITNEQLKNINQYIHGISGLFTIIILLIHLKVRNDDQSYSASKFHE